MEFVERRTINSYEKLGAYTTDPAALTPIGPAKELLVIGRRVSEYDQKLFEDIPDLYIKQTADSEDEGWRYVQGDRDARRPPELPNRRLWRTGAPRTAPLKTRWPHSEWRGARGRMRLKAISD